MLDQSISQGRYYFARFVLDPTRRELKSDDALVILRPASFEILLYLLVHAGRLVTKDELLDHVWAGRTVEESSLRQAIYALRSALAPSEGDGKHELIGTVSGRGYRFNAPVRWEPGIAETVDRSGGVAEAVGPEPASSWQFFPAAPSMRGSRRRLLMAASVIAVVGAGSWGTWRYLQPREVAHRIVLADFENDTRDPVFDRSLATVLRIDLSQSPFLKLLSGSTREQILGDMGVAKTSVFSFPVAEEVCSRTNSDAVVGGTIIRVDQRFLVTLTATDCSGKNVLADEKSDLVPRDDVIGQLDKLIARLRQRLGEPIISVDRFNVPLERAHTSSLEAVKAYSEGNWLNNNGQEAAAITAFKRAVALDPQFSAAWLSLAAMYANDQLNRLADDAVVKAYALRDRLDARQQIQVDTYYSAIHSGDLYAMVKAQEFATKMYPGDYSNWINLADAYSAVGRFADAEFIGQRAVAMSETGVDAYVNLAVAQIRQGRFSAAQTTCNLAIKRGFDAAIIHALLREIALVTGNRAEQNREQAWLASRPPSVDALNDEANIDYQAGHIVLGDATMVRLAAVLKAMGGKPVAHAVPAIDRFEIGMTDAARSWLKGKIWSDDDTDYIFALAEFGDAVQAKRLLAKQLRASPQNTIYVLDLTPSVNAALALRHHDAQAAIRALAPGFSFAWNQAERTYLLGKAYTEAGDMPHAQAAFQAIVDHPGWDPVSITLPLAQLGLARALTREGKLGAARLAYQAFLDRWHNADPDIPLLINARTEFARLGGRA